MGSLCAICEEINLEAAFNSTHQSTFNLGHISTILQRSSSCSLCKLFSQKLRKYVNSSELDKKLEKQLCRLIVVDFWDLFMHHNDYSGSYIEWLEDEDKNGRLDSLIHRGKIARLLLEKETILEFGQLYDPTSPRKPQQLRQRRMGTNKINIGLLREWLQICCEKHNNVCENPAWLRPIAPRSLRLIDVNNRSIVSAPPGAVIYAALSYMWGGTQFVVSAKQMSNLPFFLPKPPILGKTIDDALILCSQLDIPYLWVDALCITQEPAENDDKKFHLQQMDRIYRSAHVTICAASSTSASQGIPELYARTETQTTFWFKNREYATVIPCLHDMENNPWNSRGWTYQERLLSRRAILITKEQVYWVCQADVWSESIVAEPTADNMRNQQIVPYESPPRAPERNYGLWQYSPKFTQFPETKEEIFRNTYLQIVSTYSPRMLGYAADGVNAIQGVLNLLAEREDLQSLCFLQGLPVNHLNITLLWIPLSGGGRDPATIGVNGIPSWTWAGWFSSEGLGATVDGSNFSDGYDQRPVLWYVLEKNGSSRVLATDSRPDRAGVCGLPLDADPAKPPPVQQQLVHTGGYYLHFLTTCINLSLGEIVPWDRGYDKEDYEAFCRDQQRGYVWSHLYALLDQSGCCVGYIDLADREADPELVRDAWLVFLSFSRGFDHFTEAPDLKKQLPPEKEDDCPVVNCMLVRGDVENGFVERWALGKVLKAAWLAANPRAHWVVLG